MINYTSYFISIQTLSAYRIHCIPDERKIFLEEKKTQTKCITDIGMISDEVRNAKTKCDMTPDKIRDEVREKSIGEDTWKVLPFSRRREQRANRETLLREEKARFYSRGQVTQLFSRVLDSLFI